MYKYVVPYVFLVFILVAIFVQTETSFAQSTCNKLSSSVTIPAGFGASFNLFSTARELLLSGTCGTGNATITVGNNEQTTYAYNKGYYWNGASWISYTLNCSGQTISGVWCAGNGTVPISLSQDTTDVIGYTCQWNGSKWNCGCRDSACTTSYWQLQRVTKSTPPIVTPPPSGSSGARNNATLFGTGLDTTTTAGWGTTNDTVTGWDWSYPPNETYADLSGMFQFSNNLNNWPINFPGKKIFKINADWRDLEPTEGNYNLKEFDQLSTLPSGWNGVQIDVRGAVFSGNGISAPSWLSGRGIGTNTSSMGFSYYNIGDPNWYKPFRLLITKIAHYTPPAWQGKTYTVPAHPRLVTQIVHGQSNSAGEEAGFGTPISNHVETLLHWGSEYGIYSYKLGWAGEGRPQDENNRAISAGLGSRGGIIENWLRSEYTPRINDPDSSDGLTDIGQRIEQYKTSSGASVSNNFYLTVDEKFPPIAENRHFGDQNEFYKKEELTNPDQDFKGGKGQVPEKWQLTYRMATLRALQMRRNVLAIETPDSFRNGSTNKINGREGFINPELVKWASLQLGKRVDGIGGINTQAKEAFVALIRTYTRSYNGSSVTNITIHNMERWLIQREAWGETTPTLNTDYGWNPSAVDNENVFPRSLWNIDLARLAKSSLIGIGLKLDDKFISGPTSIAVKIVYLDNNTDTWTVEYKNSSGTTSSVSTTNTNSGLVKTRTVFLPNFSAVSGATTDLWLKGSTKTPFMFVRVIKL